MALVQSAHNLLRDANSIAVIAGAGLSAASGIPTFRGAGGIWRSFDAMELATPQAFKRDRSLVWQFYQYRRHVVLNASPNAGHQALASFAHSLPPSKTFRLITQNVDGLSFRVEHANSQNTHELHGSLLRTRCTECKNEETNLDDPICEALGQAQSAFEAGHPVTVADEDLPRCQRSRCGGLLRPAVVWFGEVPRGMNNVVQETLDECDLLLVVGTSSTVYPAAGFADTVLANGGKVIVFNLEPSPADETATLVISGPCEQTLVEVLGSFRT